MTFTLSPLKKLTFLLATAICTVFFPLAIQAAVPILNLTIISYEDFLSQKTEAIQSLEKALHTDGIVGIKGIPGYKEKVLRFIETARHFSSLSESQKEAYAPNREAGDLFLGYENGKEKFQREDGSWVVDSLKTSFYAHIPDQVNNKWPTELDLKTPFQELGEIMSTVGRQVMYQIDLIGPATNIWIEDVPSLGRLLYYRKNIDESLANPFWCGAHFDHGLFTALLPAFYFIDDHESPESPEAGLHVRSFTDAQFKKVQMNDPDVLIFQVGEFGQLILNDEIRATEHLVHKADNSVERYTMALFFNVAPDTTVFSQSILTQDARYGGEAGTPCTYQHWSTETFKRYIVKDKDEK